MIVEEMLKKLSRHNPLIIAKELHQNSWHHDLYFKIMTERVPYSARFIPYKRS